MKKLLFTLVMLPLSMSVMAQKLDLGLGGGYAKNAKPSFATSKDKAASSPILYAQVGLKILGFQAGVRGEYTKFMFKGDKATYTGVPGTGEYVDVMFGERVINVRAFLNKTFAIPKVEPYVGINAGYSSAGSESGKISNSKYGLGDVSGFTAGGQAGLTVFVFGKLGINGQVGFDYYRLSGASATSSSGHLLSPNVTLGIRYRVL
jgi:hypothetical protein